MADAHKVIATAGMISVGVGTINSFHKGHPPSAQFLIGSGTAFLVISALAEAEPEVAQAIALAVMTTVLLGEGGGVLSYINKRGEVDTKKSATPKRVPDSVDNAGTSDEVGETYRSDVERPDSVPAFPNLFGNRHSDHCRCINCGGIFSYN